MCLRLLLMRQYDGVERLDADCVSGEGGCNNRDHRSGRSCRLIGRNKARSMH